MSNDDWKKELDTVDQLMREVSRQQDPHIAARIYSKGLGDIFPMPVDRWISLSRRELEQPQFRVTRYNKWEKEINPWKEKDSLPLLSGGLLSELVYCNRPRVIEGVELADDDPAAPYLNGIHTLATLPQYDNGEALNMTIMMWEEEGQFVHNLFPNILWQSNLFGRSTLNLVLRQELQEAYCELDRELEVVGQIQQSLLPRETPRIDTLELATYYRTSRRAGGDYYDFLPLGDDKYGILIADVSGHGTPAAVLMAITHSIAHLAPKTVDDPSALLSFINNQLSNRYTNSIDAFVTAFYGIYDARTRTLHYSSAGHNLPRLWRSHDKLTTSLDEATNLPLGLSSDISYPNAVIQLAPGDCIVFYTDGITEALGNEHELFGTKRLDAILCESSRESAEAITKNIVDAVDRFTDHAPPGDDRTLVVATVR